jgi:fucose permease
MVVPFVLLIMCFAAWGVAANMTDPLVKVFSKIFTMSTLQSALVQFCYYGAYFCLALPAAFINRRYSYKVGVLTGLGCATVGAFLFYPASQTMTYGFFLAALFILAAGLSIGRACNGDPRGRLDAAGSGCAHRQLRRCDLLHHACDLLRDRCGVRLV